MGWAPGYRELPLPAGAPAGLSCLWTRVSTPDRAETTVVVPDACVDIVWSRDQDVFVAGPDTGPAPVVQRPGAVLVGARFRPGAGARALGIPLWELRDRRVGLADVLPGVARTLPGSLAPREALDRLAAITGRLALEAVPDPVAAEVARLLDDARAPVSALPGLLGISERQLRRRCHDSFGYGAKTLERVLRFQRFLRLATTTPVSGLAALAAAAGYADQAHLTRECARLAGSTPLPLLRSRSVLA